MYGVSLSSRRWSCSALLRFQAWSSLLGKNGTKSKWWINDHRISSLYSSHLTRQVWGTQRGRGGWSALKAGCSWTGRTSASWVLIDLQLVSKGFQIGWLSLMARCRWTERIWCSLNHIQHILMFCCLVIPPYDKVVGDVNKGVFTARVNFLPPRNGYCINHSFYILTSLHRNAGAQILRNPYTCGEYQRRGCHLSAKCLFGR